MLKALKLSELTGALNARLVGADVSFDGVSIDIQAGDTIVIGGDGAGQAEPATEQKQHPPGQAVLGILPVKHHGRAPPSGQDEKRDSRGNGHGGVVNPSRYWE